MKRLRWSICLLVTLLLAAAAQAKTPTCHRLDRFCAHSDELIVEADVVSLHSDPMINATLITLKPVEVLKGASPGDTITFHMNMVISTAIHQPSGRLVVTSHGAWLGGGAMWLDPGDRVLVFLNPVPGTRGKDTDAPWSMSSASHSLFKRLESNVGDKFVAMSHGGKIVDQTLCDEAILGTMWQLRNDDVPPAPNMMYWEYLPYVTDAITWQEVVDGARRCVASPPTVLHCPVEPPKQRQWRW